MFSLTTAEAAARRDVSVRRIQKLIQQGRIPGAEMRSGAWFLPPDFIVLPPPKRQGRKLRNSK